MRILVFSSEFPPAFRSGGAPQSVASLVAKLGNGIEFRVITRDRDQGSDRPHPGICADTWSQRGTALVRYLPPRDLNPVRIARIISSVEFDAYYVNSFFSPIFATTPVMLRWLRAIPWRPLLVAPRGSLHPAALAIKATKKSAFLRAARILPAYSDIRWHAGNADEVRDIRQQFPDARVAVARDVMMLDGPPRGQRPKKTPGSLSLAYLSRITPIKNLSLGLRILAAVRGDVSFTIYGPVDDRRYYEACMNEARQLPANISVRFAGAVVHDEVLERLRAHHAFFLPTGGESFGLAIVEAMAAGCMPIISDRTMWRALEQSGIGWDLPLEDPDSFVRAIQTCVAMDDVAFAQTSARAQALGLEVARDPLAVEQHKALFDWMFDAGSAQ